MKVCWFGREWSHKFEGLVTREWQYFERIRRYVLVWALRLQKPKQSPVSLFLLTMDADVKLSVTS